MNNLEKELEIFNRVKFDSDKHTYVVDDFYYKSVTSFLGDFKQPFDKSIAEKKALEEGVTKQIMLDQWGIKGSYSVLKGNELHHYIRMFIEYNKTPSTYINIDNQKNEFHKFYDNIQDRCKLIKCETIIADYENRKAGTVDCIGYDLKNEQYILFDWKTGKDINEDNYGKFKFPPLDKVKDCNLYDYTLQLSMYRYMLEKYTKLPIKGSMLIRFPDVGRYEMINIPYMKKEIELILMK